MTRKDSLPVWVVGDDDAILRCVASHPHLEMVLQITNQPRSALGVTWEDLESQSRPKPGFIFSGLRLTLAQVTLLEKLGSTRILSTRGFRSKPPHWFYSQVDVSHARVGGVTSMILRCHYLLLTEAAVTVVDRSARDCRTILEFSKDFVRYVPTPCSEVSPLRTFPVEEATFHSRGLLPHPLPAGCHIAVPTPFARKGFWGVRKLSTKERLLAFDFPESQLDDHTCVSDSFIPLGILHAAVDALLAVPDDQVSLELEEAEDATDTDSASSLPPPLHRAPFVTTVDSDDDTVVTNSTTYSEGSLWEFTGGDFLSTEQDDVADQITQEARERVATKSDDAEVPTHLWTQHCIEESTHGWNTEQVEVLPKLMDLLRPLAFRWWRHKLFRSFFHWMESQRRDRWGRSNKHVRAHPDLIWDPSRGQYKWSPLGRRRMGGRASYRKWFRLRYDGPQSGSIHYHNLQCGRDCLLRGAGATWWEWKAGSRPFFWRWPKEVVEEARDGMRVPFVTQPPDYWDKQPFDPDPESVAKAREKLQKMVDRGYLDADEEVESLMSFFYVPKGLDDVRMVFDGTKCGLNDAVWVPSFLLPTMETHLRAVVQGTHMCDVDVGEMFLNYMMHPSMRGFCGVDVTQYGIDFSKWASLPQETKNLLVITWNRIAMGLKWSPYQAVYFLHHAEEVIRGDRKEPKNVFRWDRVRLNLPGQESYDPALPWVSKVRKRQMDTAERQALVEEIAADLFTFVDDLRPTGNSRAEAWAAGRRVASIINWLGCQDAARKRRDSRMDPGAWAGCVIRAVNGVHVLVSEEKWDKTRAILRELEQLLDRTPEKLPVKTLEKMRGFLNYVTQTYRPLIPYLNGIHLTLDGWRSGRDSEGWRLPISHLKRESDGLEPESRKEVNPPTTVPAKPRLFEDVKALLTLCDSEKPPWRRARPRKAATVFYGFGDASGAAFGATLQRGAQQGASVIFQYGQWQTTVTEEESSNWRELANLVEFLEDQGRSGELDDAEVFMFTDNSTAENSFFKGTSKSKKLLDLILRLRRLEMRTGLILHIIHVSGKRMIAQGTDGLSRGDHTTGVMAGSSMKDFIPIHLGCLERAPRLRNWLEEVLKGLPWNLVSPEEWFSPTPDTDVQVWCPPPAAADVAVERLRVKRHMRPNALHIILVPRLMTGRWRKQMGKAADVYFKLQEESIWDPRTQFEPLLIYICFPFLPHRPLLEERDQLSRKFLWCMRPDDVSESLNPVYRSVLCKLFHQAWSLRGV